MVGGTIRAGGSRRTTSRSRFLYGRAHASCPTGRALGEKPAWWVNGLQDGVMLPLARFLRKIRNVIGDDAGVGKEETGAALGASGTQGGDGGPPPWFCWNRGSQTRGQALSFRPTPLGFRIGDLHCRAH